MKTESISPAVHLSLANIQENIVGYHKTVPLLNGESRQYINFDNAASTPALKPVLDKVVEFMEWYSSIHRGTGFKSQLCTEVFEHGREIVSRFLKVDPEKNAIIFVKNATEAINKLANHMHVSKEEVFLVSKMEHHSNDLPWRANGRVVHVGVLQDGRLDEEDLLDKLRKYRGKIALVALTGAANVTGWVNDVNRLAALCHKHGSKILVDAAQLAPHRAIDMRPDDDPSHIDFLALSAHKMYAPFGAGVLVGPKDFFKQNDPDYVGGGTISIVGTDYAHWAEPPEKEEAGTPNTVGVVALAKTLRTLLDIGMEKVAEHEKHLTRYVLTRLREIPEVQVYGGTDPEEVEHRLGVIAFNIKNIPHALTASILNYEGGIGVRNGCFCAHPYVKELLGVNEEESKKLEEEILAGDRTNLPGAVRASFGIYNTTEEIDAFVKMLKILAAGDYRGEYLLDRRAGEYRPKGFHVNFRQYFQL